MSQVMHDVVERLISRTNTFIQNNKQLWQDGLKLILLNGSEESKSFLSWYEKPKYWTMYKPIKGNQNRFQLVKLQVSNKGCSQFIQSSNRTLPCQFEYNHAVKIQTFEEYQQLLKDRVDLQNDIKGLQKQLHDQATIASLEQNLRNINVQYFGLLNEWKIKESTCRIIILTRGEQFKDLNYFIYNEQTNLSQITKMQIKTPLTKKLTNPHMLKFMAQIIKIHHVKRKNQAILQQFLRKFKKSIGSSFNKAFQDQKEKKQRQKKKLSQNQMLINSFRKYQYKESKSFIQKWQKAVKNVKLNLFVQIFTIFINKEHIPESVKLIVDGSYQKVYDYQYFQKDYLVYVPSTKNDQKFFKINIQNSKFCRPINFQVEVKLKNSQTIRYDGEHIVYVLNKDQSLFTQESLLQNSINSQGQLLNQSTYCIIYLNQLFSRTQNIQSLVPYFQSQIFQNTGQIPTKYLESYKIDYNPQTFKTIQALLNNQSYSAKISKSSFQRTYYQLVKFSQKEENLSQRSIVLTPTTKRINKFAMKDRFQIYTKKLLQGIGFYAKGQDFQYFFKKNYQEVTNNILSQKNISIPKNQHKNFLQDLNIYNPKNPSFVKSDILKFIYFAGKVPKIPDFPYQLRYSSHLIPIFESLFELYTKSNINDLGSNSIHRLENYTTYLLPFIAFFARLYPYSQYNNLKSDLYILRWLVQKKLPNFNDNLNRNNIGLQNFISEHLLHLFTGLPSQLTYRIWDLLISTQQRDQARILVTFTLLTFYQTTDKLPIIPINQFMDRVEANIRTISVDKQFAAKFAKIADNYYLSQKTKQERLIKHIKSQQSSIVDDRILKRIILGQSKLKIPYQQEGKVLISRAKPFQKDNCLTIKQLRYPLPEANYFGSTIIQIIFFLHDLHILENINLNTNKYWLKFYIKNTEWKDYTQILNKDYFYNKSIRIPSQYINFFHVTEKNQKAMIQRHIQIDIVTNVDLINRDESRQKIELKGFIDYSLYNKDKAYKLLVNLSPQTLHNKGRTILSLTMCLKSHEYDCTLAARSDFSSLQTLSEKLLDYDLGISNECITARNRLCSNSQKIKYPLDQFSSDQYKRVINRALNQCESDWMESSKTSIEQLKAIFYNIFSQERDKSIKHQLSKFYQIFAEQHNMQFVYFAQILVKFILLSSISRKKKLMYLYCLGVHYQNCYSKKVNQQTINSLIRLIFKQNCLINALPMLPNSIGKIIEAYYFQSDLKTQRKKDFTDIVQDWAYICNLKYGYSDIILGTARDLSILRSFFDAKTLKKIQSQKQCRFEIIYELDGFRYIWSATVDPKTFAILKRGTKFLNQFTGYSNIKYLDSTQEYLLNCENVIPLHNHRSYTYEQFSKIMLSNHLVRYLLDLPPPVELLKKRQEEQIINIQWQEDKEFKKVVKEYNSWAICRGQNCLESWHKCKITKIGKIMSKVSFQFDKEHQYNIATLDLISMDEADVHSQKK